MALDADYTRDIAGSKTAKTALDFVHRAPCKPQVLGAKRRPHPPLGPPAALQPSTHPARALERMRLQGTLAGAPPSPYKQARNARTSSVDP
jgi:hypothetical protein